MQFVSGRFSKDPLAKRVAFAAYATNVGMLGARFIASRYLKKAAEDNGEGDLTKVGYIACLNGSTLYFFGQLCEAETTLNFGITVSRHARDHFIAMAIHFLRHVHSVRGEVNEIIATARQELDVGVTVNDPEFLAYAHYGLCHGLALKGKFNESLKSAHESTRLLNENQSNLKAVALMERGFLYLQMSDYESAFDDLSQGLKTMRKHGLFFEIAAPLLPRIIEASLGPNWIDGSKAAGVKLREARRYTLRAQFFARIFPNVRPHVLRSMGRYFFAKGKPQKARRLFEQSVIAAETLGARFDHARSLDDLGRAFPELKDNRIRAREILAEIGAVMPSAECVDYNAEHSRALNVTDENVATIPLPAE